MPKQKLSSEILKKIFELNSQGRLNRDIARQLNTHHTTIAYHLQKNNVKNNWGKQNIDIVSDTEAKCTDCGLVKPLKNFWYKTKNYEYKFAHCAKCRDRRHYLNLNNDIKKYLKNRFIILKNRCNRKNIIFKITKEQFIEQYYAQNELCFYTDKKMSCEVGSGRKKDVFSIDKIIPEKGYVYGNVVFCCSQINTCKSDLSLSDIEQWMPKWYEKIQEFTKNISDNINSELPSKE